MQPGSTWTRTAQSRAYIAAAILTLIEAIRVFFLEASLNSLLFQGEGVDVGGRGVAKHQRCIGGIQAEP